jgi:signal transduction histidine kinase
MSNGKRIEFDSEKVRKDGIKVPCIVTATPFREPNGKMIGIVEDFKDISDRKKFEEELLQSRERLRDLAAHLQIIREEERKRIAREIHDELGQALTALKMDLYWLGHRLPKEQTLLVEKTKTMATIVDRTVKSVKRISSELRPGLLDDLGLSAAIEWQAEEFTNRTGIPCELRSDPVDIVLDQQLSIAIFRIFQETLTNIARHANATKVKAILKKGLGKIEMMVSDNGKGLDNQHISDPKSYGLIGMYERVHSFGGDLAIRGKKNLGTTIEVSIPINE